VESVIAANPDPDSRVSYFLRVPLADSDWTSYAAIWSLTT